MKLCVALDLNKKEENLKIIKDIKSFDNVWLKVGLRSFIRDGVNFLDEIKNINPNFKIFLDLKLYDIPNTMADASEEIAKLGIDMFNIHASAGSKAMQEVTTRLKSIEKKPLILAVTALTSFSDSDFKSIYEKDINTKANQFAKLSSENGIDGVVCSSFESKAIKKTTNENFITLCPGIRPFGEDSGDQQRVATIEVAKQNLVDFIVVGRPIYKAQNPKEIVERILEKI